MHKQNYKHIICSSLSSAYKNRRVWRQFLALRLEGRGGRENGRVRTRRRTCVRHTLSPKILTDFNGDPVGQSCIKIALKQNTLLACFFLIKKNKIGRQVPPIKVVIFFRYCDFGFTPISHSLQRGIKAEKK